MVVGRQVTAAGACARKACACLCAIALMLVTMAAPLNVAYAAGSYSITISGATSGSYSAYQLLAGTYDSDGHLGSIAFDDSTRAALLEAVDDVAQTSYSSNTRLSDVELANAVADTIAGLGTTDAQALAETLAAALTSDVGITPAATATASDGSVTLEGIEQTGYYLVVQTSTGENEAISSSILIDVTGDVTAEAKVSSPTLDKSVKDTTSASDDEWDSTYTGDYSDVADAALYAGALESVGYQLVGTLASNIASYTTYAYAFVDTLPTGITLAGSAEEGYANLTYTVTACLDSTDESSGETTTQAESIALDLTVAVDEDAKTTTITWDTSDLIALLTAAGFSEDELADVYLVVDYTVTLDDDDIEALYGSESTLASPQTNSAYVEFSNNPYADGTGTTPEDTTNVYSYNLTIAKVDASNDGAALSGAAFTLTATIDGQSVTVGNEITADENGVFTFTGLESGVSYTITETTTPDGYKSIDPITFSIDATVDGETVTAITATEESDGSGAATLAVSTDNTATVTATIANVEGADLPLTGSAGILLGVLIGGGIIAASAVALIRQRKNEA